MTARLCGSCLVVALFVVGCVEGAEDSANADMSTVRDMMGRDLPNFPIDMRPVVDMPPVTPPPRDMPRDMEPQELDMRPLDMNPLPPVGDMPQDLPPPACDFQTVSKMAVFEMESLPLTEDWKIGRQVSGASGGAYIFWDGSSHNNDPTHGVMRFKVLVKEAGRYRLWLRNRIGAGTNATEHNDIWARFPDANDYYGVKISNSGEETRRYPKPKCEDDSFMGRIRAQAQVTEARCANGSTRDGWMKVYSSGATDWKWSSFTSDNDAHQVVFVSRGNQVITVEIAARADLQLLDVGVLHELSVPRAQVEAMNLTQTSCPK